MCQGGLRRCWAAQAAHQCPAAVPAQAAAAQIAAPAPAQAVTPPWRLRARPEGAFGTQSLIGNFSVTTVCQRAI
jgi:hypothetical protein